MRDKAGWRRWARDHRPTGAPDSAALVAALTAFLIGRRASGWIVTYRSLPHELDVSSLEQHPELGPFALTRTAETGRDLSLHPAASRPERHRWGFDQPAAGSPEVPVQDVAVILVPGLVFDRRGQRLGHGLGYYDRLLARLPSEALRIGVVEAALVVETLPVEPHDILMTHLATEHGVAPCRR